MEDYRYHGNGFSGENNTEFNYATNSRNSYELRSYSATYAQTQMEIRDSQFKKGKSHSGSVSKSWSFSDPEFQRKKRVANYKMYSVEGKMKGSFRNSFRWLKRKCEHVVYGWW
ncbi:hypothetical protein IC582_015386 [Cucumis melo]|uniref:Uncharacterized protein n=1 Tax=Cucumis melo var. makuwa TaxID=1194695 RepID=A0A5D3D951_CUCMM|nr:uncharacterized protein E6C27_scaffold255G002260 [Cucumis melo var. makuwa]TYK20081.1 uncharacterized protein E5676_scaffold134G002050 [Cucumis melo var. makuwa]